MPKQNKWVIAFIMFGSISIIVANIVKLVLGESLSFIIIGSLLLALYGIGVSIDLLTEAI